MQNAKYQKAKQKRLI